MPFTKEQFIEVFIRYNTSVFPLQAVLILLALIAIFLSIRKVSLSDRIITIVLSILWMWTGVVYHLIFFSSINKGAYAFGILYIIQSLAFLYSGVIKNTLNFTFKMDVYVVFGIIFLLYALLIYPILNNVLGHPYPASPSFGLPCPLTIFTFGLLMWTEKTLPKYVLYIPLIWSIIGFFAALNFGIYEDIGLLVTGITAFILLIIRHRTVTEPVYTDSTV
jgi:hypothetical protein